MRPLHGVVPTQGGGVVFAANRVGVANGSRAHRGVAEARGDGREVHALGYRRTGCWPPLGGNWGDWAGKFG